MKIMWMSRHKPTKRQMAELKRLFGACVVEWDNRRFSGADDIVTRFKEGKADEMVLVGPLTLFRELVKRGIKPLYATMEQVKNGSPETEVQYRGRCYKFVDFKRVVALNLVLEPIEPIEERCPTCNSRNRGARGQMPMGHGAGVWPTFCKDDWHKVKDNDD